jgi:hypothetical protein
MGLPLAEAVKIAVAPAATFWLVGPVHTTGAVPLAAVTVNVAGKVVAFPAELVKTA